MFDDTQYTDNTLNTGEFLDFANVFSIELMSSIDKCQYNSYMSFINNRFVDLSFLIGLGSNLVGQLSLFFMDPYQPSGLRSNKLPRMSWQSSRETTPLTKALLPSETPSSTLDSNSRSSAPSASTTSRQE
eukprot:CAMPEP_0202967984 /NCGR_PEP_ID=MMETSP1396-20130829/13061_1 /ASSEMBLY_ACC=CAM_ASM_000872 /TAXON_ID= /ORGANISM="Pseudokeronopsis sp., Strain Brazil" /LENGTH=129 /DNA_ID=CAMNT_0049693703 /DNA_START=86 /DNA_END=476 /DNA_ORIENTATION=-